MPRRLQVREMTGQERETIQETARPRTAAAREVECARIIRAPSEGRNVSEMSQALQLKAAKARKWIHRFNERGLAGLVDEPRAGRPAATYRAEEVSRVLAASLTDP
jgi:transposase